MSDVDKEAAAAHAAEVAAHPRTRLAAIQQALSQPHTDMRDHLTTLTRSLSSLCGLMSEHAPPLPEAPEAKPVEPQAPQEPKDG